MACPRELFSSLVLQPDSGPAFWCLCPGLNADRTPPGAGHHSWVWARGFESLHFFHTHTFSVREGCGPEGPRVCWRREYLPERSLCPPLEPASLSPHPAAQLDQGSRLGRLGPCIPAEPLLLSQEGPAPPVAWAPAAWPRIPECPPPGSACPAPPGDTADVFPGQSLFLGSLWPRCPVERVQAWRTETDRGLSGASPRSDGTMGELCSQTARPYKSCPASAAKNSPSSELCLCPSSQDVVFLGGASSLLGLRVFKTVSLAARAPSSPEWGRLLLSPSHTWTDRDSLGSPHRHQATHSLCKEASGP